MKTSNFNKITSVFIVAAIMMIAADAFAQGGRGLRASRAIDETPERPMRGQGFCANLPDITQEQLDQIDALRLKALKENQQIRSQLGEKQARRRTLSIADQPSIKAINKIIDEIADLKAEMQKNRMATHQEIRKLLNEEQRVIFDERQPRQRAFGMRKGRGFRNENRGFRGRGHRFHWDCPFMN